MNETIISFLQQQTCTTICCINEQGNPYCFNCYYAFNSEEGMLYFKSSVDSRHSVLLKKNPCVAGTILPDKLNILLVKGVQFEGFFLGTQHPLMGKVSGFYYKKHPIALAMPGEIHTIQINHIKMTDSTKGFGKKINWDREAAMVAV